MVANLVWTDERKDLVKKLWLTQSGGEIAKTMGVTRNAILGLMHRMGRTPEEKRAAYDRRMFSPEQKLTRKEINKRASERRRMERWAQNPALAERYERALTPSPPLNTCSKTSVQFRKYLPRPPEMTKNELRAMFAQAVRNTALMEGGCE